MASLAGLAQERTDLGPEDVRALQALVADWALLSDLAFADLVLWLPTWNEGGFVAAAQVRPATGPTRVPDDVVGSFVPRGRMPQVDRALAGGRVVAERVDPAVPAALETVPVRVGGRVIAVLARHSVPEPGAARAGGRLEEVYLHTADLLAAMVAEGTFPPAPAAALDLPPRVGDGLLLLDAAGRVTFASPNAASAFRRLGLAVDLVGAGLAGLAGRLWRRPGPVDESLAGVAGGRTAGGAELDNGAAAVTFWCLPLLRTGRREGALILVRDVTDLRHRERALLSKDATIREIHHRVKNNLQTVAALLRLQARRSDEPATRAALSEAVRRVAAIAVVHEALAYGPGDDVDFDAVCDRLVALAADAAVVHADPGPAPTVLRDGSVGVLAAEVATPLAMALSELLANAVEHAGARRIVCRPQRTSGRLVVDVVDDGIGLSADALHPAAAGGLGLQIVRTLVVDELGGHLDLAPGDGGGTVATVSLPLGERPAR